MILNKSSFVKPILLIKAINPNLSSEVTMIILFCLKMLFCPAHGWPGHCKCKLWLPT